MVSDEIVDWAMSHVALFSQNVEPFLNANRLDVHGQAPYKSSHPIVLTSLIQDWGGAKTRTAPMGDI